MKIILTVFILAMTGGIVMADSPSAKNSSSSLRNGQRIFSESCASCHSVHGTNPSPTPGLKSFYKTHSPRPSDADVRAVIHNGKGKMPGFTTLSNTQVDDLIVYLKTL